MEETKEQQQTQKSKEQSSHSMKLGGQQKEKQMSSAQSANELKSLSQTNQQRKVNSKEVDFLVKQLGIDTIKATNILKKLDLKQAVKYLVNN